MILCFRNHSFSCFSKYFWLLHSIVKWPKTLDHWSWAKMYPSESLSRIFLTETKKKKSLSSVEAIKCKTGAVSSQMSCHVEPAGLQWKRMKPTCRKQQRWETTRKSWKNLKSLVPVVPEVSYSSPFHGSTLLGFHEPVLLPPSCA